MCLLLRLRKTMWGGSFSTISELNVRLLVLFSDKMRNSLKLSRHRPKSLASLASPSQCLHWASLSSSTSSIHRPLLCDFSQHEYLWICESRISPTASLHPVFSPCKTVTKECFHRGITVSSPVSYMEKNKRLISLSSFSWQVTKKYTEGKKKPQLLYN